MRNRKSRHLEYFAAVPYALVEIAKLTPKARPEHVYRSSPMRSSPRKTECLIQKPDDLLEDDLRLVSVLHRCHQTIASGLDQRVVLSYLAAAIMEFLDVEEVSVFLHDTHKRVLIPITQLSDICDLMDAPIPDTAGITGWSLQTRQALFVNDAGKDSRFCVQAETPVSGVTQGLLAAPMSAGCTIIGVLRVMNKKGGLFTEDDLEAAEKIADCAASVIQNARLLEAIQEQNKRLQALQTYLVQVEKMADLGRIAATLAHEINNPLQAMQSHLELAMDFPLNQQEQKQCLSVVRQEIGRLSEITERVLNFARPAAAQPRPVFIAEVVRQTLALTSKQLQHCDVQVSTDIPEALQAMAVPDHLVQVFLNLIINAVEAIQNHGHIQVSAYAEGTRIVVLFVNNGPVIPEKDLPHVFEPYFTSKPDGTGLGLPVSYSLVQENGGKVSAANLPDNKGVEFRIELPLS